MPANLSKFAEEFKRVLAIQRPTVMRLNEVPSEYSIEHLDSLSCMEVCVLAEEHLGETITIEQVKKRKTYGDLLALLCEEKA